MIDYIYKVRLGKKALEFDSEHYGNRFRGKPFELAWVRADFSQSFKDQFQSNGIYDIF